MDNVIALEV